MTAFPQGKLIDFFRFFDPSNQNHIAAINCLQSAIEHSEAALVSDEAAWVQLFRTPVTVPKVVTAKVDNSWNGIIAAGRNAGAKFPELLAAQWALESGFGKHVTGTHNYWGIKGNGGRNPQDTQTLALTTEFVDGVWETKNYWFLNFPSIEASSSYVVNRWYKDFKQFKGINRASTRDEAAHLLVTEGYATDPDYAVKLIELMDQYSEPPAFNDGGDVMLNVPYFSQIDSDTDQGFRMCFSSSCAMALDYICPGVLENHKDDFYLKKVMEYGDTTDPYAQLYALDSFGIDADFKQDLSLEDVKQQINNGVPVPIGILHKGSISNPTGGHWVTVIGYNEDGLIVNDPMGDLDLLNGAYIPDRSGATLTYPYQTLLPRWTVEGDGSGWGIIIN